MQQGPTPERTLGHAVLELTKVSGSGRRQKSLFSGRDFWRSPLLFEAPRCPGNAATALGIARRV